MQNPQPKMPLLRRRLAPQWIWSEGKVCIFPVAFVDSNNFTGKGLIILLHGEPGELQV